jgi:hypothetical protein
MLKLVINNTQPSCGKVPFHGNEAKAAPLTSPLQNSLLVDFSQLCHNLYAFNLYDFEHKLDCKMNVDIRESYVSPQGQQAEEEYLVPKAFCNFPHIDVRRLAEKVSWDEYLQGAIMVQFQLKILEQLLLCCDEKDATHVVLTISNNDYEDLEVYRHFAISEEQVNTEAGNQTEIVISTDIETYDEIVDFMDAFDADFQKTLWRNQKSNLAFRKYLTDYSLSVPS